MRGSGLKQGAVVVFPKEIEPKQVAFPRSKKADMPLVFFYPTLQR